MITRKILLTSLFVVSGYSFLHAGTTKTLEETIAEKVEFRRKDPRKVFNMRDLFSNYDENSIVEQAEFLTNDPNEVIKRLGYGFLVYAGRKSEDQTVRRRAVETLVNGLVDKKGDYVLQMCAKTLRRSHTRKNFSKKAKTVLRKKLHDIAINPGSFHYSKYVILIVGVADMQTEMEFLRTLSNQRIRNKPTINAGWAGYAMARMGDKEAIKKWISSVDSVTDEDDKVGIWLGRSTYIRQPEIVDYIKPYLYSDKMFRSRGGDVVPAWYSSVAAKCLEEMIVGFPTIVEVIKAFDKKRHDDLEFANKSVKFVDFHRNYCRQWLESQTSIEMKR
ncbi:MAG: hypothetical protein FVQ82_14500 [Planctomycetes bacterium]|nr:hypothetical protein [Planctomycetota bacterium]